MMACAWLMSQGFDVFKNQNDNGPVDIIAFNRETKEQILVDAKTIHPNTLNSIRKNGYRRSKEQIRLDVQILGVTHEGACFWCTKGALEDE